MNQLTEPQVLDLNKEISELLVEGHLKQKINNDIKWKEMSTLTLVTDTPKVYLYVVKVLEIMLLLLRSWIGWIDLRYKQGLESVGLGKYCNISSFYTNWSFQY